MNPIFRFVMMAAATWAGTLVLSIVLIGVAAAVTQRWSASRMQPIVAILLGLITLLSMGGIWFVHSLAKRTLTDTNPWFSTVLYGGGAILTLLVIGFIALVVLNR